MARSIRILHTADWHLGAHLDGAPREAEHSAFLDDLLAVIERERIDALLVSGDVFHYPQPSAEAQRQLYRFLASCAAVRSLRQIVLTAGNHDSPTRLTAPGDILRALDVVTVGSVPRDPQGWGRLLVPLKVGRQVAAVVAAVPYVHAAHLGVRRAGSDAASVRAERIERHTALYRALADEARSRWPGAPLVAMGHLTCAAEGWGRRPAGRERLEGPRYGTGSPDALPPSIFDPRYAYVALGHLHEPHVVEAGPAGPYVRYPGSPVPLDVVEGRTAREVVRLTLSGRPGAPAEVEAIPLRPTRGFVELAGTLADVEEQVRALRWGEPLPPFVYATLEVERLRLDAERTLRAACEEHPEGARPRLVRLRQVIPGRAGPDEAPGASGPDAPSPVSSAPEDVFARLCRARRGVDPSAALMAAFRAVAAEALREGEDAAVTADPAGVPVPRRRDEAARPRPGASPALVGRTPA